MPSEKIYEELCDALKEVGGAIPVIPNEELFLLLRDLVTQEEASLAITLPSEPITAEALAERLGRSPEQVAIMLEAMTDKGFLHALKNQKGLYEYRIMPLLPGIFEGQFYRGTKTERDYRIAHLFKGYLDAIIKIRDSLPSPPPLPSTSYFRVLPIEKEIEASTKVLPHAQISRYVEQTETIAVGTCFCRHHAILLNEKDDCGVSHKNCMAFGEAAIFMAERHMGRLVSKDEALEILTKAEEEGLVHCSANTSEEHVFICNCCTCHCGILSQAKLIPHSSLVLTSGYHARVDSELCTACETCTERCPVSAITVEEEASVDPMQCIGCGLCTNTCPSEAIELIIRPDTAIPPERISDLEAAIKER